MLRIFVRIGTTPVDYHFPLFQSGIRSVTLERAIGNLETSSSNSRYGPIPFHNFDGVPNPFLAWLPSTFFQPTWTVMRHL